MRVKVCGTTDPENIEALLSLPIDYIGFIFYNRSKRYIGKKNLGEWIQEHTDLFGDVKRVGVFVNAEVDEILNMIHDYQLDYVQLHGNESAEYCAELRSYWEISSIRKAKVIKAFPIDEDFDFELTRPYEGKCELFLFDTNGEHHGGNGITFDWSILENYNGPTPFLLAGGIDSGMEEAIRNLSLPQLIGVDINSKFELEPGLKDVEKVKSFTDLLNPV